MAQAREIMAPRVAAVDLGKARVGLAVSDELGMLAHPRPALDGRSLKAVLAALAKLAADEKIARFVVGVPLELSGQGGVAAQRAVRFCQKLADATGCEVELVDERLSTVEATRRLREGERKDVGERVDSAAAAILLQQWLDAHRS
jgi:putative holliday junction resolvase